MIKLVVDDLFERIKCSSVRKEPFPHLVVDDFLPQNFYKQLARQLDSDDFSSRYQKGLYGGENRYCVDLTDFVAWQNSGCRLSTAIHEKNYKSLLSMREQWLQLFVKILLKNEKKFCSVLCSKLREENFRGDYFFHISMAKDRHGFVVEPHTDSSDNVFTVLFYAPETDCNRQFGLTVYNWNREFCHKIPFLPNRLIVFVPTNQTWHGVDLLTNDLKGTRNSIQMFFLKNSLTPN